MAINHVVPSLIAAVDQLQEQLSRELELIILVDTHSRVSPDMYNNVFATITVDFDDPEQLRQTCRDLGEIVAVTCRTEKYLPHYAKLLEAAPELVGPTAKAIRDSSSKAVMRDRFAIHAAEISPAFIVCDIDTISDSSIVSIANKIGFPCMVKPSGLHGSLLVQACRDVTELYGALQTVKKHIHDSYKKHHGRGAPQVVVEQKLVGDMYSVDVFVMPDGTKYYCPLVAVTTGAQIGQEDYYGYHRRTPIDQPQEDVQAAQGVAGKAIDALGLRSTTCHVELFKTDSGWKIIEVGPRTGGYRSDMYSEAFGLKYAMNDLAVRIPITPDMAQPLKRYCSVFNFYAKQEGVLVAAPSHVEVMELASVVRVVNRYAEGDTVMFARHGGQPLYEVVLAHDSLEQLDADCQKLESLMVFQVE